MATNAPALVHPTQQSVRPSALPSDRSHTDKWLQVRAARRCTAPAALTNPRLAKGALAVAPGVGGLHDSHRGQDGQRGALLRRRVSFEVNAEGC